MKIKTITILIAVAFLAGCAGIQFKEDASQAVLYKLAGHRLGYELAKKDPATAQIALKAADGIIQTIEGGTTSDVISAILQEGLAKLAASYKDDPALIAEIAICADLVVFKGDVLDLSQYKAYSAQMKAGLEGYKLGYALAIAVKK